MLWLGWTGAWAWKEGLLLGVGPHAIANNAVDTAITADVADRMLEHEQLAELWLEADGAIIHAAALGLRHLLDEVEEAELELVDRGALEHARGESAEIGRLEQDVGVAERARGLEGKQLVQNVLGDGMAGQLVRFAWAVVEHDAERSVGSGVVAVEGKNLDGIRAVHVIEALAMDPRDQTVLDVEKHAIGGLGHEDAVLAVEAVGMNDIKLGPRKAFCDIVPKEIARGVLAKVAQSNKGVFARFGIVGDVKAADSGAQARLERMGIRAYDPKHVSRIG
jgi:hypothetical protein